MEYKAIQTKLEIKEDIDGESGMFISGYFSIFGGPPDAGNDIVDKGAFLKTIRERGPEGANKIVGLWHHREPFGMPIELKEDKKGGWFRMKLTDTPENRETRWPYLTDKVVQEVSFAYDPIKYYYEAEEGKREWERTRHLQEVLLREISPVTFGMNDRTSIDGFKSVIESSLGLSGLFSENEIDIEDRIGRIVSIEEKRKIKMVIARMNGATKALEALLDATEPEEISTPESQEPRIKRAEPSVIAHLAEMKASFENLQDNLKKIRG